MENCFNLIIGVELIRMVYTHRPGTVFEVLLFAIARQVIIEHGSPLNSLISVVATICSVLQQRKFLSAGDLTKQKNVSLQRRKSFLSTD